MSINHSKKLLDKYFLLKNLNLRPKITISFSVIILLLLILVFVSYQIITNSLIIQTQESTCQLVKQTSKTLEAELGEIDRLALAISRNQLIGDLICQFENANPIKKSSIDSELKEVLSSLIGTRNDISNVIIITNQGACFIFPPHNSMTSLNFKPFTSYAYRKYQTTKKSSLWLDTYLTDNQGTYAISPKVITILKEMYIPSNLKKVGLVQINLKESYFSNLLIDVKSSYGGSFFVFGKEKNIILNPQEPASSGKKLNEAYLEKIMQKTSGFFYHKINSTLNLIVFDKIERTSWFVSFTIPVNNITRNIHNATNHLLLIGILCILVGIIFSFLISYDISTAVTFLESRIKDIKNGNLDVNLILERNDEFGRLSESFQKMVLSLKTLLNSISIDSNSPYSSTKSTTTSDLNELISETQAKFKKLVDLDPLTGAYNRRFFEQYYQIELNKLHANLLSNNIKDLSSYLGIAFIDIDNFKRINDTYGHHIGDLVLKDLVEIIMNQTFARDLVCRYGGEEFVIIFTQTDPGKAIITLEKIRKTISEHHFCLNENIPDGHITISIGVSFFPKDHLLPEHLIKIADKRLYVAKNTGKNRIVCE